MQSFLMLYHCGDQGIFIRNFNSSHVTETSDSNQQTFECLLHAWATWGTVGGALVALSLSNSLSLWTYRGQWQKKEQKLYWVPSTSFHGPTAFPTIRKSLILPKVVRNYNTEFPISSGDPSFSSSLGLGRMGKGPKKVVFHSILMVNLTHCAKSQCRTKVTCFLSTRGISKLVLK